MRESVETRLTILVVEDERFVRAAIVEFLRSADCDVIEAESGEEAIETLREHDGIDAVFTDIRLAGALNGWDVGEAARETKPESPVLYTSGASILPERPVPGSVFFPKPYHPEKVLNTCRALCGR